MRLILILGLLLLLATSCTTPQAPAPAPKPVSKALSWGKTEWDAPLIEMITSNLASLEKAQDIASFCPKYKLLADDVKPVFWAELVVAIAKYESNWNPTTRYMEPAPLNYESLGLLQLSYEDQKAYPFCKLDRASKNLFNPLVNLKCGVGIMARLIAKDAVIAKGQGSSSRGLARYWSVMRENRKLETIKQRVKATFLCS